MSDLQFDTADYDGAAAGASCSRCQRPLRDAYWQIDGQMSCEECAQRVAAERAGGGTAGRLVRAITYGSGAGAVGAAIWYGIRELTGYEIGLIAVAVGVMVGLAVRKGSGGRGGRGYQVLAVVLTYGAIVSTYVPMIVQHATQGEQGTGTATAGDGEGATSAGGGASSGAGVRTNDTSTVPAAEPIGLGAAVVGLGLFVVFVAVVAVAAPFLGGFDNVIGILIIGFGLWEAWRLNRFQPLDVTGPHALAAPAA